MRRDIYDYAILSVLLALTGCVADDPLVPEAGGDSSVRFAVRKAGGTDDGMEMLNNDFVPDKSRIHILNHTSAAKANISINSFVERDTYPDGLRVFRYDCYSDEYVCHDDHPGVMYNAFKGTGPDDELKWAKKDGETGTLIIDNGAGNYEFSAVYCPVTDLYEPGKETYPQPFGSVSTDQTRRQTFASQDILAARTKMDVKTEHGEPVHLVFHHMLAMVIVNVDVPLYSEWSDGTGFDRDKLTDAAINNVYSAFTISFPTEVSSGDAIPSSADNTGELAGEIKMYPAGTQEATSALDGRPVQRYRFCAIIPSQIVGQRSGDGESALLPIKFFSCNIEDREGNVKPYGYIPSLHSAEGTAARMIELESGKITVVNLSISRVTYEPILVSAQIIPWNFNVAEFILDEMQQ